MLRTTNASDKYPSLRALAGIYEEIPQTYIPGGGPAFSAAAEVRGQLAPLVCSQNSVTIACALFGDDNRERIFAVLCCSTLPIPNWVVGQRKQIKNAGACESCMADKASGGFMRHCC